MANQTTNYNLQKPLVSEKVDVNVINQNMDKIDTNMKSISDKADNKANSSDLTSHTTNTSNPHSVTKSQIGLGNVGNFKAVSTVANQGLNDTEKANARANIGAGVSSFSGSYNDLSNKPTIPNAFSNVVVGSTTISADNVTDTLTLVAGSNITITPDATNDKITISSSGGSSYTLPVATSSALGGVKSGTDITVDSSGNVSVNDDSHNHVISNVDGLQSALDGKAVNKTLTSENLNNVTTPGFYNAGGSNSVTNKPSGVDAFGLEVIHNASGNYYTQILYMNSQSTSYRRYCINGTWGNWTEDKLTDTNTVTTATTTGSGNAVTAITANNGALTVTKGATFLTAHPTITTSTDSTSTASPAHGGTFTAVDSVVRDSNGHVTKVNTKTITLPTDNNTDTKVTQTVTTSNASYPLLLAPSGQTATATTTSYFDSGVTLNPSTNTIAANVSGNSATSTKWASSRNINGMSVQGDSNRFNYGTCSTGAATTEKTVACTGYTLATGSEITIKFTVTNTASSPTLNVNSTGAKAIYYRGSAISAGYLAANRTYTFRYNGTQYELVGDINTDSNTKNTAGSTNSSSKLFLIGATSQAANPQTYSHDTAYVGTDGCLYSNNKLVTTTVYSSTEPTSNLDTGTIWIG